MPDPSIINSLAWPKSLGQKTSAESFPVVLPSDYTLTITGVATEATLLTIKSDTGTIVTSTGAIALSAANLDVLLSTRAADATVQATNTKLDTLVAKDFSTETTLAALKTSVEARASGSLVPAAFDYIGYTSGATTDTYVYKTGGAGGTTVKTITVSFTDATKAVLSSVAAT